MNIRAIEYIQFGISYAIECDRGADEGDGNRLHQWEEVWFQNELEMPDEEIACLVRQLAD